MDFRFLLIIYAYGEVLSIKVHVQRDAQKNCFIYHRTTLSAENSETFIKCQTILGAIYNCQHYHFHTQKLKLVDPPFL